MFLSHLCSVILFWVQMKSKNIDTTKKLSYKSVFVQLFC